MNTFIYTKTLYILNNKGFYFIVLFKFGTHVIKTVNSEIIHSKCHEIKQLRLGFGEVCCTLPAKYPAGRRPATSLSSRRLLLLNVARFVLFPCHTPSLNA